jgi:hypothetical protein
MSADTAEHYRSIWERDLAPFASPAPWVLTDADVPVIGWNIIADRPDLAYLADPDAGRPATPAEMEATEAAAYLEYAAALAANAAIGTAPRGPWPAGKAAVTAPEPAAEPEPLAEAEEDQAPGPLALLSGAYRAASGDKPAEDPAPAPGPIAQLAAEANGLGELTEDKQANLAVFNAEHDAQDEREATAQIEAVGDATEVTPAVTEAQS